MPKRFTATEKWTDPWFCNLRPIDKLFWVYLLDNCNHAGIWQVNWPLIKFHLGEFEFKKEVYNNRIIELSKEKWFIPKFISFQYIELNPENRAHQSVITILKKEGVYKELTRGLQGRTDKAKDKDMVKDKDKDRFLEFVLLTKKEYQILLEKLGEPTTKEYIERLNNYIGTKGREYKSHYHAILTWVKKDKPKESEIKLRRPL